MGISCCKTTSRSSWTKPGEESVQFQVLVQGLHLNFAAEEEVVLLGLGGAQTRKGIGIVVVIACHFPGGRSTYS